MPRKPKHTDPVATELEKIHSVLQDFLIIECARSGMTKAQAREAVGVDNARVTRIWKNLKLASQDQVGTQYVQSSSPQ